MAYSAEFVLTLSTRNHRVFSKFSHQLRSEMAISKGWILEDLIAVCNDSKKSPLFSVVKTIGLERLIWSGNGAPSSLVKNVWSFLASVGFWFFSSESRLDRSSCSEVNGNPDTHMSEYVPQTQQGEPSTFDINMGRPVAFFMRYTPRSSAMQTWIIFSTDTRCWCVLIVKLFWQRR